jgi:tetratricopeptide (TPR) repeat protein
MSHRDNAWSKGVNVRSVVFAFVAVLVSAHAALAQQPSPTESEARRHYEEGTKAFALGEFNRAVGEYRAAYNAKPDPAFLYNIAQAYRLAGDLQQALFFYRSFLSQLPASPNRDEVERRIEDLSEQLQRQKVLSTSPPNNPVAPAQLGGKPGESPTLTLSQGPTATSPVQAERKRTPAYKKWWVWTIVGVAVAGAAVGVGVGLSQSGGAPSTHFGTSMVF